MLKLFKKKEKQNKVLSSMANGKSVAIEDVPDEVFSTKMMGDGIAVIPDDGKIYAPCNGKISMVMDNTKHALGIETEDGMELLIHVGLDTVTHLLLMLHAMHGPVLPKVKILLYLSSVRHWDMIRNKPPKFKEICVL